MAIRTYRPGDEAAQVSIYNEAAAPLPKFKAATLDEVRRRGLGPDTDPSTRFFALADGRPVGYATFHANGRVSYPWLRPGHEGLAGELFGHVLAEMKRRGLPRAFAAYRADWPGPRDFFVRHGFQPVREMVNFVMDLAEMPTPSARPNNTLSPLSPADVPAILTLAPQVLAAKTAAELEKHFFHNPYFPPDACFVVREKVGGSPLAVGLVVTNPAYADPKQVDAAMPCFRLGAFGTEGMQTKRINGLFSFLAADNRDVHPFGLDLLAHAAFRLEDTDVGTLAAQVPSDATYLLRFYKQYFRRQGSFPIYERNL